MNSRAAYILGFFGAVFGALTLSSVWHWSGPVLLLPFGGFLVLAVAARRAGDGLANVTFSPTARAVLIWSTLAELLAIVVGIQIVMKYSRPDLVIPVIALAVGLHFLPIGRGVPQPRFTLLGIGLIVLAIAGFLLPPPVNMAVSGIGGCVAEWAAAWSIITSLRARQRSIS